MDALGSDKARIATSPRLPLSPPLSRLSRERSSGNGASGLTATSVRPEPPPLRPSKVTPRLDLMKSVYTGVVSYDGPMPTSSATPAVFNAALVDNDSDAETIVLPGKDGHSPSQFRKVRQEDTIDLQKAGSRARDTMQRADNVHPRDPRPGPDRDHVASMSGNTFSRTSEAVDDYHGDVARKRVCRSPRSPFPPLPPKPPPTHLPPRPQQQWEYHPHYRMQHSAHPIQARPMQYRNDSQNCYLGQEQLYTHSYSHGQRSPVLDSTNHDPVERSLQRMPQARGKDEQVRDHGLPSLKAPSAVHKLASLHTASSAESEIAVRPSPSLRSPPPPKRSRSGPLLKTTSSSDCEVSPLAISTTPLSTAPSPAKNKERTRPAPLAINTDSHSRPFPSRKIVATNETEDRSKIGTVPCQRTPLSDEAVDSFSPHEPSMSVRQLRSPTQVKRRSSECRAHEEQLPYTQPASSSPHDHLHRRSHSTQLSPSHPPTGLSHKKKRLPPPIQPPTDYRSDDSAASDGPRRTTTDRVRNLATPAGTDSYFSPAKLGTHKKYLDAHGQTLLARACARGEIEIARQRLLARPEDINFADYAGNTPLQIAAINGHANIVKLLLDHKCNCDCVNYDKDTPLLDAVENGHIDVVRLLLQVGVNPRKANVHGEEPLERINDELDYADEIRALLLDARKHTREQRQSEDRAHVIHDSGREPDVLESPHQTPSTTSVSQFGAGIGSGADGSAASRRTATVRATKTSHHLLYLPMTEKNLLSAAGRGDKETVTRILLVRNNCSSDECLVAAARGGHDVVMQLLLALGDANPDPAPVSDMPSDLATPMLAAIGQENIKVVRLLLDQASFDPTRQFHGQHYFEIAKHRQGPNWIEEEQMLKTSFDEFQRRRDSSSPFARSITSATVTERANSDANKKANPATNTNKHETETETVNKTASKAAISSKLDLQERDTEAHGSRRDNHKAKMGDRAKNKLPSEGISERDKIAGRNNQKESREKQVSDREKDADSRRGRIETKVDNAKVNQRALSSPLHNAEARKKAQTAKPSSGSPTFNDKLMTHTGPSRLKRKSDVSTNFNDPASPKRPQLFHGPTKQDPPHHQDRLHIPANISEREVSPTVTHKSQPNTKKADSEIAVACSDSETVKPRKRLISKGELKGEKERERERGKEKEREREKVQKRLPSTTSDSPSLKDSLSPHNSKHDGQADRLAKTEKAIKTEKTERLEKQKGETMAEKNHDRSKLLRRPEFNDAAPSSSDGPVKRYRSSMTSPKSIEDKDDGEIPAKRRRLETDGKGHENNPHINESPEMKTHKPAKTPMTRPTQLNTRDGESHDNSTTPISELDSHRPKVNKPGIDEKGSDGDKRGGDRHDLDRHVGNKYNRPRGDDVDVKRVQATAPRSSEGIVAIRPKSDLEKKRITDVDDAKRKEEYHHKRLEAEERRRKREKEEARRAEEDRRQKEDERKRMEEEDNKRKETEERQKVEEERARREDEERERMQKEAAQLRHEQEAKIRELERKRIEEEERRKAEEVRLETEEVRRQEEERQRLEEEQRVIREAAEHAKRQREEAERKERERRDRLLREELERKRVAREAEQRRIREEQIRARLAKLPALLRWLDMCPNPRVSEVAAKFWKMQGVRYDTIYPEACNTADGREQWVLNTHVALLLGEKDLDLSRYTAWERIPVSEHAKKMYWNLESDLYGLTRASMIEFGLQLPHSYYGEGVDPEQMRFPVITQLRNEAREKFFGMDLFFVRVSDLMYLVAKTPHLRGVKLAVQYRELSDPNRTGSIFILPRNWTRDPGAERFMGMSPMNRYFINGEYIGEDLPGTCRASPVPFPENRVPRRNFRPVPPDDPEYDKLCRRQGLHHLVKDDGSSRKSSITTTVAEQSQNGMGSTEQPYLTTHGITDRKPATTSSSKPVESQSVTESLIDLTISPDGVDRLN